MATVHAKLSVVVLTLLIPLLTFAQTTAVPPQQVSVEGTKAHVYKSINGGELRLHVFSTANSTSPVRRQAILFFFGGGWTGGSVRTFAPQATHLAQRGMVAIVADYRVFGRHGTSPFEAMADAKSAVRWVRAHSAELGIDPNRIVAAGDSAGGHIALSAAVFDTFDEAGEDKTVSSKPNALVLFNPAVDTTDTATHTTAPLVKDRFGARGVDGSPFHHLGAGRHLRSSFMESRHDRPYADVERFCAEVRIHGTQCQLVGYEGATHGFFLPRMEDGKRYRETLLEVDWFLTTLGYLPEPAVTQIR